MKAPNTASLAVGAVAPSTEQVDPSLLDQISQGDVAPAPPAAPLAAPVVPLVEAPIEPVPEPEPEAGEQRVSYGSGETSGQRPAVVRPCDFYLEARDNDMLFVRYIPTNEEGEMSRADFKALLRG